MRWHARLGWAGLWAVVAASGCMAGGVDAEGLQVSGTGEASAARPIINGEACDATVAPTAVAILLDHTINFFGQTQNVRAVGCTGTLIAPDVVLTAAHCLDPSTVTLGLGEVTREAYLVTFEPDLTALAQMDTMEFPADAITARAWVKHADYGFGTSGGMMAPEGLGAFHDIGLIFLSTPVTSVAPAVVITAEEATQMTSPMPAFIAGWGQQTVTDNPLTPPPDGTLGRKVCGTAELTELGDAEFRIGSDAASTRKCHGDSGGPTYITVTTDSPVTERVVGVTSRAYNQEDCNVGGVDTRVSAHLDWLDARMREACTQGNRTACDDPGLLPPPAPGSSSSGGSSGGGSSGGASSSGGGGSSGNGGGGGDTPGPSEGGCASSPAGLTGVLAVGALVLARRRRHRAR